jgi:hypothetical protein
MNCKVFAKNLVASSILVLLPFCAGAAFAHNFALIPDSFNPAPGSQSSLYGTFTHVVGAAQYSFGFAANMFNIKKLEVYRRNNGSTTPIGDEAGDFEEYHYEKKAPDAVSADCSRAAFDAPGSGTTVLFGKFTGEVDMSQYGGSGIVTSYSFTKTFLNLTNDGAAAERLGEDANAPEVVFA